MPRLPHAARQWENAVLAPVFDEEDYGRFYARMQAGLMQVYPTPPIMRANAHWPAAARSDNRNALKVAVLMQVLAQDMESSGIGWGL